MQSMSLADRSALLSSKESLKRLLLQIDGSPDPPLITYGDNYIPWLEEAIWKAEFDPKTRQHFFRNTQTGERREHREFTESGIVIWETVRGYSEAEILYQFEITCTIAAWNVMCSVSSDHWARIVQPWKWKKPFRVTLRGRYASVMLWKNVSEWLKWSNFLSFSWYMAAYIDWLMSRRKWYNFEWNGLVLDRKQLYTHLTQFAYNQLDKRERKKRSLASYREQYAWLSDADM